MTDVVLIVSMILVFSFGYFLMARLDGILDGINAKNRDYTADNTPKKEPSYIMLTDELTPEEMINEIMSFRAKHRKTKVILCDSMENEIIENNDDITLEKR